MPPKGRILVIDDDEMVGLSCERALQREYAVQCRTSGAEGLAALEAEPFDCALLDLKLPDMGGMEVLRQAKDRCPEVPVVIITGYSTVQAAVEAIKNGAFDYLAKPFTPDELEAVVEKATRQRKLLVDFRRLQERMGEQGHVSRLMGESPAMRRLFSQIEQVAPTDTTVLLSGETGVGKDLVARAVHFSSPRQVARFVAVDCGAVPASLIGSELFGHARGAFTGAATSRTGLIRTADGGTLFLDEIGSLPMDCQSMLLRAIESREVRPVGVSLAEKVDVRFIAASNQNLLDLVERSEFRQDLFYRLNVFPIRIPPLRERKEDIPLLARHFLGLHSAKMHKRMAGFSPEAMDLLVQYDWPGNVRELSNIVERLVILCPGETVGQAHVRECLASTASMPDAPRTSDDLKRQRQKAREDAAAEVEKRFLLDAMRRNEFNVTRAADETGMQRTNFQALLRKHGLRLRDLRLEGLGG